MTAVSFFVHGAVAGQGSMAAVPTRDGRVWMKHDSPKTEPWRATVGYAARQKMRGREMLEGALVLTVRFWLPRPKSVPKSREFPNKRPDLDKLCRAIGDALEGIVYANDSQICSLRADKHYGGAVGAEITVETIRAHHSEVT
jgi:crossover junction endodeoxyribonuclease RusA